MSTRVLVVDDTVVFRRIVSDALNGMPGVEVVGTASNGRLAMSRLAALQPDLVTLDIEMPEMNGIEVLEAMAAAGMNTGVIMLSSLTVRGGELTVRALELGAFDFLTKPEGGDKETNLSHLRARLLLDQRVRLAFFRPRVGPQHDLNVAEPEAELLDALLQIGHVLLEPRVDQDVALRGNDEECRGARGSDGVHVADDFARSGRRRCARLCLAGRHRAGGK